MSESIGEFLRTEMTTADAKTLRAALVEGIQSLRDLGIESAQLDAEVLLCEVLGRQRVELYLELDAALSEHHACRFRDLLARRRAREPVAYITAKKEFWSLEFLVTRDVLIPRPESELLVEVALELARQKNGKSLRILDIGTGSGAIAVAIAKELPDTRITATDVSITGLEIARKNAERFGLSDRIDFHQGDLFGAVAANAEGFNVIVSNPPYIRSGELGNLSPEIHGWEPVAALDGGKDGLDYYRRMAVEAHRYLADHGSIVVEIGADMANDVSRIFAKTSRYSTAAVYQDYAGRDRVLAVKKL